MLIDLYQHHPYFAVNKKDVILKIKNIHLQPPPPPHLHIHKAQAASFGTDMTHNTYKRIYWAIASGSNIHFIPYPLSVQVAVTLIYGYFCLYSSGGLLNNFVIVGMKPVLNKSPDRSFSNLRRFAMYNTPQTI